VAASAAGAARLPSVVAVEVACHIQEHQEELRHTAEVAYLALVVRGVHRSRVDPAAGCLGDRLAAYVAVDNRHYQMGLEQGEVRHSLPVAEHSDYTSM